MELGRGVLDVVGGALPLGVETDADIAWRKKLLRKAELRGLPSHVVTLAPSGSRVFVGDQAGSADDQYFTSPNIHFNSSPFVLYFAASRYSLIIVKLLYSRVFYIPHMWTCHPIGRHIRRQILFALPDSRP